MKTNTQNFKEAAPEASATSASAIIAFLLGFCGFPAIIMGHIALARIKNSRQPLNGRRLAVLGIIFGWLSMIVLLLIVAVIAFGMPWFWNSIEN